MISKGFYFSSKIEKNKGDRDFNTNSSVYSVSQDILRFGILRNFVLMQEIDGDDNDVSSESKAG